MSIQSQTPSDNLSKNLAGICSSRPMMGTRSTNISPVSEKRAPLTNRRQIPEKYQQEQQSSSSSSSATSNRNGVAWLVFMTGSCYQWCAFVRSPLRLLKRDCLCLLATGAGRELQLAIAIALRMNMSRSEHCRGSMLLHYSRAGMCSQAVSVALGRCRTFVHTITKAQSSQPASGDKPGRLPWEVAFRCNCDWYYKLD